MGCDIHVIAEIKTANHRYRAVPKFHPFEERAYCVFGWLAGVRNYSQVGPLVPPRGFPLDNSRASQNLASRWQYDLHNASYISIEELAAVDYSQIVEDRRCTGQKLSLTDFLGKQYMDDLARCMKLGVHRIVFFFDN